jgi:hypothetical protein
MYIGKCDFKWAMENPGGSDECGCFVGMGVGKGRVCPHQGFFFSQSVIFTGGDRNFWLPQNLENLRNLPDEIIQTNFEFEFFSVKISNFVIQI